MNMRARIFYNFLVKLKTENEIISILFPYSNAWNSENTAMRAVAFHAKFVTFLTIACLCSQKFYHCNDNIVDDEIFALGEQKNRWWMNGYVDFPDIWET